MKVLIQKLNADAKIPQFAHKEDAGADIFSAEGATIKPGEIKLIATGIKISLPQGYEAQVRPKSGLALNHGISLLNTPGTIDAEYRGEVKVILINHGKETFKVEKGQKIAQLIFNKVELPEFEVVEKLDGTGRNEKGFGSTGLR